jgi:hypothetical protein
MTKTMLRPLKRTGFVLGLVAVAVLGLGVGTAAAVLPTLLAPAGVSAGDGIKTEPMPDPKYPVNEEGLTYGSLLDSNSPENEPDLILVVATNGKEGYAKKSDLDVAHGPVFKSPAEALAWQEANADVDTVVPVYEKDGKTVIGEFVVYGQNSTREQAEQAGLLDH